MNALIFGAGKTGRGLCALLCQRAGWSFTLVDKDQELIACLQQEDTTIQVLNDTVSNISLPTPALHSNDKALLSQALTHDFWFSAVFGENVLELGGQLGHFIQHRAESGSGKLYILTCENKTHAAQLLRDACIRELDNVALDYLNQCVHFIEGMVLKTCIYGDNKTQILAQDFYRLPCDADAFKGFQPDSDDLQLLPAFEHQLERKIYTYNAINAVISYLGVQAGYTMLSDAANDPSINARALAAADICNAVLVRKFNFDKEEQQQWSQGALDKFANQAIPDPLERNVAAVRRKLSRTDRLLAPALLALEYQLDASPFVEAIVAALLYKEHGQRLIDACAGDLDRCLTEVCELNAGEELYHLLAQHYHEVHSCG